jgi:hypothetical protein
MLTRFALLAIIALPQAACSQESPPVDAEASGSANGAQAISEDDIFRAAGFVQEGGNWRKCGDPGTPSYEPGAIMQQGDFNGDGNADAIVSEGSTYCFGMAGLGYTLVSQTPAGEWRVLDERGGIPRFLETRGAEGWPDIQVGGPGFCFPVIRWDGEAWQLHRTEYQGKPCQR